MCLGRSDAKFRNSMQAMGPRKPWSKPAGFNAANQLKLKCKCALPQLFALLFSLYFWQQLVLAPKLPDYTYAPKTIIYDEAYNDNSRAIFFISMGKQAQQSKIVERFVWSVRNRGLWRGWLVLITDAPQTRYANLTHHFIAMNPQRQHFNSSFAEDMPYKRFKTFLFDYVDMDSRLDSVSLVYYLDVDIVVLQSLIPMMYELEHRHGIESRETSRQPRAGRQQFSTEGANPPRVWFFEGNYKKTPVQGGQMILERYSSKPCLEKWRHLIDQHPEQPKDQPYLLQMLEDPSPDCEIRIMPKDNFLHFPSNKSIFQWVKHKYGPPPSWFQTVLFGTPDFTVPTMIHIKNSGKVGNVSEDVEALYLQGLLQLPEGQQDILEIGKKMHFKPDRNIYSMGDS
jgi:hypothetical protein